MNTNHITNSQHGRPFMHDDEHLVILFTFICIAFVFLGAILF